MTYVNPNPLIVWYKGRRWAIIEGFSARDNMFKDVRQCNPTQDITIRSTQTEEELVVPIEELVTY